MSDMFYVAWVDPEETTFAPEHIRNDEDVFAFRLRGEEGQIPYLLLTIKVPRNNAWTAKGLLAPSRKKWLWFSWLNPDTETVEALFFGRLVAIPDSVTGDNNLLDLQILARASDWLARKYALADSLKVPGKYDALFIDESSRGDPDTILEGYSANFAIDRVTLDWTISDILQGEDGTEVFTADDDVIEGTVSWSLSESQLRSLRMDVKANWTQNMLGGSLFLGAWVIESYTDGVYQQWPKPGTSLGGGWAAGPATFAKDLLGIEHAESVSESGSWSDRNHEHREGDGISGSWSATTPTVKGFRINWTASSTIGNIGGDNAVNDTSSSVSETWTIIPKWKILTQLDIVAEPGSNGFSERLSFTMSSGLQPALDDVASKEFEVISLNMADVGAPLIDYKAWSSLTNPIALGQICQPLIQTGPGGLSYQICIQAGNKGLTQPTFPDFVGDTTVDGTVIWASLGGSLPSVQEWQPLTYFPAGTIISIAAFGGWFFLATTSGTTGAIFSLIDGGVVWANLGAGGPSISIPIGGRPGNVFATSYFNTPRGAQSLEYIVNRGVARLRRESRAVTVHATVPFGRGVALSCRKNATIYADILPGGVATGKVTSYELYMNEDGDFACDVTIGSAIGTGGSAAPASPGDPTYVETDYTGAVYQVFTGTILNGDTVAHSPPAVLGAPPAILQMPIAPGTVVVSAGWTSNLGNQKLAIEAQLSTAEGPGSAEGLRNIIEQRAARLGIAITDAINLLELPMNSVYFDLVLRPISGFSYDTPYGVEIGEVAIPKQIDLTAE